MWKGEFKIYLSKQLFSLIRVVSNACKYLKKWTLLSIDLSSFIRWKWIQQRRFEQENSACKAKRYHNAAVLFCVHYGLLPLRQCNLPNIIIYFLTGVCPEEFRAKVYKLSSLLNSYLMVIYSNIVYEHKRFIFYWKKEANLHRK